MLGISLPSEECQANCAAPLRPAKVLLEAITRVMILLASRPRFTGDARMRMKFEFFGGSEYDIAICWKFEATATEVASNPKFRNERTFLLDFG